MVFDHTDAVCLGVRCCIETDVGLIRVSGKSDGCVLFDGRAGREGGAGADKMIPIAGFDQKGTRGAKGLPPDDHSIAIYGIGGGREAY